MRFDGFFGGSYESRAVTADAEKTINWYPELLQSSAAPSRAVLYPTPGVEEIYTAVDSPGRAHLAIGGREFAMLGTVLYEFDVAGSVLTSTDLGGSASDGNPATITSNGPGGGQILITSGGNAWYVDITTTPLSATPITALNDKAHFGGFVDGYFVALDTNTSKLYVSELNDGATWNTGTEFAQRSLAPDPLKAMKVAGRTVWLFGEQTSEPWINTGARFPFAPAIAGVVNYGIAAPWSAETLGDSIIWLATSRDGRIAVVRAQGFAPQVISTYPLEMKIQEFKGIAEAVADAYSDAGHSFYLLNFDREDVPTLAWDAETGIWCERGTWIPESNRYTSWRPRFYAFAFGEHRMLDTSNGNLYRISSNLVRDVDGRLIRRLRRAPGLVDENKRAFYSSFELDLEPGLGRADGHVGFWMYATATDVIGFVEDAQGDEVPGAEVVVELDGDIVCETTTDETGTYECPGLPDGAVTVTVSAQDDDGNWLCGTDTGTAAGHAAGYYTWTQFGSRGTRAQIIVDIVLNACSLAADFSVVTAGGLNPGEGTMTGTPTVTGGSGQYTYLWLGWTEYAGDEDQPDFTSTDEVAVWEPLWDIAASGICDGNLKLFVVDAVTAEAVEVGPKAWTWNCV